MNKRRKHQLERILYISVALLLVLGLGFLCAWGFSTIRKYQRQQALENGSQSPDGQETVSKAGVEDASVPVEENLSQNGTEVIEEQEEPTDPILLSVQQMIADMTLKEKVYQLFIITPDALTGANPAVAAGEQTKKSLTDYPVGGLVYFAKNLTDEEQTRTMLSNTQDYALETQELPLFLCVDEEGGKVARIASNPAFGVDNVGDMQDITQVDEAYKAGEYIGSYLQNLGFNLDFAPDADVRTNDADVAIGKRSFGSDPQQVSELAKAYSDGLHEHDVMSTFKHFPGHGAVAQDTHDGFAYTQKSYDELMQAEWVPFQMADDYGIDVVMVGHISLPAVTGDDTPASLSEKMVSEILRTDLGYDGLIVTDALNMGAITQKYSSSEACVKAFAAGADLLLMPADFQEAADGMMQAVQDGSISEDRLDESLLRIVYAKLSWQQKSGMYRQDTDGDKANSDKTNNNKINNNKTNGDKSDQNVTYTSMIDVSAYQGNIDWTKVADSGVEGAMIRLGFRGYGAEGSLNTDKYFSKNLKGAKAADLKTGVYFYSEAKNVSEAEEEALYVLGILKNETLELPVAYDLEYSNSVDKRSNALNTAERTELAQAFCKKIQEAGYEPMVYYDVAALSGKTLELSALSGIKVWVADYEHEAGPAYTGEYQMWQYSNCGSVSGIKGAVDLNHYID